MTSLDHPQETRLNVRLSGPLADHVNRQVDSDLYSSHSEYIRDLVRRDMESEIAKHVAGLTRAAEQLGRGEFDNATPAEMAAEIRASYAARKGKK
jgi:Arc/MetJ-type ribon-helix-helix transcriptional regulator